MNMKLLISITLMSIFQWTFLFAQKNASIGFLAGSSDYIGELNQSQLFTNFSGASFGAFYKIDLTERYALKSKAVYGSLPTAGSVSFLDVSTLFEFSFYDFEMDKRKHTFTPYITSGLGVSLLNNQIFLPFGFGCKVNLSNRTALGAEWLFRKTAFDKLEANNIGHSTNPFYNNDYYSTLGVFISYKFFKFADDCPVYER